MSVYGQISHHLIRAREVALSHDCATLVDKVAIDGIVYELDVLLKAVRRLHHEH